MTPDLWIRHRAPYRYSRHVATLPESSVLSNLFPTVAFFTGLAALAWYSTDPSTAIPDLALPKGSLGPVTSFLGLLLVFRTNQSYDRWWEARKIWGGMLNRTRDYAVQGLTWFDEKDLELKKQHVRYIQAFSLALKVHLRSDEDMRRELTGILTENELKAALAEVHVPNHILRMMSGVITEANMDPYRTVMMSRNITFFEDVLGKCERILKTPLPLSYTRHTSRFIFLWLTILPFTTVADLGATVIPVELFTAMFLLGIEDIGVLIEEPFSVLACEAICGSVIANTTSLLQQQIRDRELVSNVINQSKTDAGS